MDYAALKLVHQGAVALSIGGFVARGIAALVEARWQRGRAARTLPHVVDTLLLASALGLAWMARLNPITTPWLMAKIVGLLLYIGLGMVALRPGLPRGVRAAAFLAALLCFGQIVAMAISKSPAGLLAWI
ncbi:MAG: SirB2 family protein [Burkholderiaceae bacterium]